MRNESVHAFYPFRAVNFVERRIDFREVPDMWAMQDCRAEFGGLDRVLTAVLDQRASDKYRRCHTINQAKLTDRVGDINLGVALKIGRASCRERGGRWVGVVAV